MEHVVSTAVFNLKHFDQWPLWQGESDSGTILLISDIVFDLEAQLDSRVQAEDLDAAIQAKERLFQTLSNFTDPYSDEENFSEGYGAQEFNYSVTAWDGALRRSVISNQREFDVKSLEELEHVVEGTVDELGVFTGRVKAFGRWLDGEIVILPKNDISNRSNSKVGEFHLRLGTFQQIAGSSSHPPEVHRKLLEQSIKYGGVMVYRNGLRVMPYGREDSDFFEIEKRRSFASRLAPTIGLDLLQSIYRATGQAGRSNPNVLRPPSLCTNTSPPCICAIALTMANPSPWLAPLLWRAASTR